MAKNNFKIPDVYLPGAARTLETGFGIPFVKRSLLNVQKIEQSDKPDSMSIFNTPLYSTLFIHRPKYSEFLYDEDSKTYTETTVVLSSTKEIGNDDGIYCDGVIISVSLPRNIVITTISGLDGSIKEFINNGDYTVNIKGYFASKEPNVYPDSEVRALNSYCRAPVALKITNKFLNSYLGITDLVVTNLTLEEQEGVRNIQFFEMSCISDVPFEILEKKA